MGLLGEQVLPSLLKVRLDQVLRDGVVPPSIGVDPGHSLPQLGVGSVIDGRALRRRRCLILI